MFEPVPQPERRRRPRALADLPLRAHVADDSLDGRLRDLSEIGLRCTLPRRLPVRAAIAVEFSLPGSIEVHRLTGRAVRCQSQNGGAAFTVGVQFDAVPPVVRATIAGFVAKAPRAP